MRPHDHDETLLDVAWTEDVFPYTKNRQLLRCPKRPDLSVGYAMNASVLGMAIEDIPEEGVHEGRVNVGFVDGHVKLLSVDEAKKLIDNAP